MHEQYQQQFQDAVKQRERALLLHVLADVDQQLKQITLEQIKAAIQTHFEGVKNLSAEPSSTVSISLGRAIAHPAVGEHDAHETIQKNLKKNATALPGYSQVHGILHDLNVACALVLKCNYGSTAHPHAFLHILSDQPYAQSPHAHMFFPNTPSTAIPQARLLSDGTGAKPGLLRRAFAKIGGLLGRNPGRPLLTDGTKKPKALVPGGSAGG